MAWYDDDPVVAPKGLNPALILVRQLEGSGDAATSPKGARGRYQIMPDTARRYGFDPAKLGDEAYAARVASAILDDNDKRANGRLDDKLVLYNASPRAYQRWVSAGRNPAALPEETRKYLARAEQLHGGPLAPPAWAAGDPVVAPVPEWAAKDPVVKPGAPTDDGGVLGQIERKGGSLVGGLLAGGSKLAHGLSGLADAFSEAQLDMGGATGQMLGPDGQPITVPAGLRPELTAAARAHPDAATRAAAPVVSALAAADRAVAPAERSGLESFLHGAAEMAPALVAGAVDPLLMAGAFAGQGYGEAHDEATAKGAGEDVAREAGVGNALVQGGLGLVPVGEFAGAATRGIEAAVPRVAARLGVTAGGDAALGAAMQTGSNLVAQQTYDPAREWYEQVPESAAMMAGGGLIAHGLFAGAHAAARAVGGMRPRLRADDLAPEAARDPAAMPEANAVRAYQGLPPLEAENTHAPLDAAAEAERARLAEQAKGAALEAGDPVLVQTPAGVAKAEVVAVNPAEGERPATVTVRTGAGLHAVPLSTTEPLPRAYEAAREALGAPLEQMPQAGADVAEWRSAAPAGASLFRAIRNLGGLRTRDAEGRLNDVGEILREVRHPGLVNNKTGLDPDTARELLQERGWFGEWDQGQVAAGAELSGARRGDTTDELLELLRREAGGRKVFHPADTKPEILARRSDLDAQMQAAGVGAGDDHPTATAKLAAWRGEQVAAMSDEMADLRARAELLGIEVRPGATRDEVLEDVLEREATRAEAGGHVPDGTEADHYQDAVERELTPEQRYEFAVLTADEHEWLSQPERGPRGREGEAPGAGNDGEPLGAPADHEGPVGPPGEGPGLPRADQGGDRAEGPLVTTTRAAPLAERQDIGGETVDQTLLPGAERSARQAAQARAGALKPRVAQREAGELFAPPEAEAGDLFPTTTHERPKAEDLFAKPEAPPSIDDKPPLIAATPEAREARARAETPRGDGYGERNKVFTKEQADAARARIRDKLRNQLNAGLDPELMLDGLTLAGYHIEAGARKFGDFVRVMTEDLGERATPYLKMWYNAVRDHPHFDPAGMTPHGHVTDDVAQEIASRVLRSRPDLEQDRAGAAADDTDGAQPVPAAPGEAQRGPRGPRDGDVAAGGGAQGRDGLPDRGPAPLGERGPAGLQPGAPGDAGRPARRLEPGGGDAAGDEGVQPDRAPAESLDRASAEAAHLEPISQGAHPDAESVDAPPVSHELEAALPTLFPEQRADVAFAEARFEAEDGHGVLFTNGTGTGKTFTGGGIAKRFYDQGKKNILVLAPTQGILNHWTETMEKLGVPFHVLEDTARAGKGPVGTTYAALAANRTLADRTWDLVISDEAHTLSSAEDGSETLALRAFRAITNHPDRLYDRAELERRADVEAVEALKPPKGVTAGPLFERWRDARQALDEKLRERVAELKAEPRAKAAFLSATPFAYDKSIEWAHGYLFDFGPEPKDSGGYNTGSARDQFFMRHFGYRMRYNKLTKPEAAVESEVMEREFHEWLRRNKVLSGRALTVDKDYDRKFVLVEGGVGRQIDEALDFLRTAEDGRFRNLAQAVEKRFDYLSRARLLEAIKAKASVPIIRKHLALGRKVVVFHNYNDGGGFSPFEYDPAMEVHGARPGEIKTLHEAFIAANPQVTEIDAAMRKLPAPLVQLGRAFPTALVYNGRVPKGQRERAKKAFNTDGGPHDLIIVQSDAGQAGISLHDVTGRHQRVTLNLGLPGRPVAAIQQEGRTYRIGQASDAIFRYLNTGTNWERRAFATKIAERAGTAENLALGAQARTLRQAFVDAFLDSAAYPPMQGEGRGGKAADRALAKALTEFQRAKSFYFGQAKKARGRKNREGVDYFATPEPVGLKMVEWADIRPGDHALEPSAGHGAIARFFPETAERTLVEPSDELASRAELVTPGARVLTHRFEDLHAVNKFDAIVMNPPFGHGGATAIDHLAKAANHLKDGGRIVALIPEGPAADARFETFYESDAAKGLYKIAEIKLPTATFERAGTSVRARVVVLERHARPEDAARLQETQRDYSGAETITELFDRIEHASLPERALPPKAEVEAPKFQRTAEDYHRLLEGQRGLEGLRAAVRTPRGRVYEGASHSAAEHQAPAREGLIYGFTDDRGRFITRTEAERRYGVLTVEDVQRARFQRSADAHDAAGQPDIFAGVEPLVTRPAKGPFAAPAPDPRREHFDQNHADLARLATRVGDPAQRTAEAERLASEMGVFMDWDGHAGAQGRLRRGEPPTAAQMVGAAREYVRAFGENGRHALYDPEAYHDLVRRWYEAQGGERPQFQRGPVFYSAVERVVSASPMKAAPTDQWKATLANAPGVKREELEWTGVNDWLDLFKGEKVPKEKLEAFLRDNGVRVEEKVLGEADSTLEAKVLDDFVDRWVADTAETYMDRNPDLDEESARAAARNNVPWRDLEAEANEHAGLRTTYEEWTLPGGENYRELLLTLPAEANPPATHWDTPGVLAHVRFDERTDPEGRKILFVQEIQSDWHQKGRDQGYATPASKEASDRALADYDRAKVALKASTEQVLAAADRAYMERMGAATAMPDVERAPWRAGWHPGIEDDSTRMRGKINGVRSWLRNAGLEANAALHDLLVRHSADELRESEAHQAVRLAGGYGIPDAPFKTSWPALVMKRMIRWAADHGFERVAWTTGEQQGERYDLTKHIGRLTLHDNGSGGISDAKLTGEFDHGTVIIHDPEGRRVDERHVDSREQLEAFIGKDLTTRLLAAPPGHARAAGLGFRARHLEGLDVKIGDEGMRAFYDRNLVNITNDLIKKYGGKVEKGPIDTKASDSAYRDLLRRNLENPDPEVRAKAEAALARLDAEETPEVHGFEIPPTLREVASGGFPLFKREMGELGPYQRMAARDGEPGPRVAPYVRLTEARTPDARAQALIGAVDAELARIAPFAEVRAAEHASEYTTGEHRALGGLAYRDGLRHVVIWALDSADPLGSGRHEALHTLKDAGLFHPEEWDALSAAALSEGWLERYKIDRLYAEYAPEDQVEEAIAERFREWRRAGEPASIGGLIHAAFTRLARFLDRVRDLARRTMGKGPDARDVLARIESGEVGSRLGQKVQGDLEARFARRPPDEAPEERPPGFVNRALGQGVDSLGRRLKATAERWTPDPVADALDSLKLGVSPMGMGSTRAQAEAKDFANALRANAHAHSRIDEWLGKSFTPEQRQRMWAAADEHGVILRRGAEPGPGEGLNRLTAAERHAVEQLQRAADDTFERAKSMDMVTGEGLESYVPRMVATMTATGVRPLARASPRQARKGANLSVTTGQLRQRKYETVEETEAAARASFGKGALVIRDIRTLNLATQRLEAAIAGRALVDKIKALSKQVAADLPVIEGGGNPDPARYFTLEHPALTKWAPRFIRDADTGKTRPLLDEKGDLVFEASPIWIPREFEGPLKAVLSEPANGLVKALLALKAKMIGVVMYNPLIHNAVIWGKAIPADPRGVLTFEVYRKGNAAKLDPRVMNEAIAAGLDPIGRRFFNQDLASIADDPAITPGRSWTSQVLGFVPGLFSREAGDAVKRSVDAMGDVWHNTFLWDRVADLQMGIYTHVRDGLLRRSNALGIDARSAQRIAAHFANRYAGALPMEGMSKLARTTANLVLFSRSFTLGNLAAYKDIVAGLPSDVRAQILRDGGLAQLERVQGAARQKATAMLLLDIGLSIAGLTLAAAATAWLTGQDFQAPWDNEEDRKNRFLVGYQKDGTAIYGRLPTGKVGEELYDWTREPRDILLRKLSPFGKFAYLLASNDKGFGRPLNDPDEKIPVIGPVKHLARAMWRSFGPPALLPEGQLSGMVDLAQGTNDPRTAALRAFLPFSGVTVSKGAPGGPAQGDLYRARAEHDFRVQEALPGIRDQLRRGDIAGARAKMRELGVPPGLQNFYVRTAANPSARFSRRTLRDFLTYASPEEKAQFEADRQAQAARAGR